MALSILWLQCMDRFIRKQCRQRHNGLGKRTFAMSLRPSSETLAETVRKGEAAASNSGIELHPWSRPEGAPSPVRHPTPSEPALRSWLRLRRKRQGAREQRKEHLLLQRGFREQDRSNRSPRPRPLPGPTCQLQSLDIQPATTHSLRAACGYRGLSFRGLEELGSAYQLCSTCSG